MAKIGTGMVTSAAPHTRRLDSTISPRIPHGRTVHTHLHSQISLPGALRPPHSQGTQHIMAKASSAIDDSGSEGSARPVRRRATKPDAGDAPTKESSRAATREAPEAPREAAPVRPVIPAMAPAPKPAGVPAMVPAPRPPIRTTDDAPRPAPASPAPSGSSGPGTGAPSGGGDARPIDRRPDSRPDSGGERRDSR